jgi:hypothetical protein
MNEERWNAVRKFYMDNFNITPELVDLMASNDVLLMCVSGSSNSSISKILDIDEATVAEIIHTVFNFSGWGSDIELNPYNLYKDDSSYISFVGSVVDLNLEFNLNPALGIEQINTMYFNCLIYSEIEDKLDKEWV